MNETSFISHRMFVAALGQETLKPEPVRVTLKQTGAEAKAPPGERRMASSGKEVMAALVAQQLLGRQVARGI